MKPLMQRCLIEIYQIKYSLEVEAHLDLRDTQTKSLIKLPRQTVPFERTRIRQVLFLFLR